MDAYYRDKKVKDMTREELIKALEEMSHLYNKALKRHATEYEMEARFNCELAEEQDLMNQEQDCED